MTDWEKIRTGFVKDGLSYRALSREFAAPYSTIQRRGIKEDWPGQREEYLEENVGEKMKQVKTKLLRRIERTLDEDRELDSKDFKAVLLCLRYAGIKVMIIRKTYPELQENHIIPLCEMLGCYADESERIASYNDGKKHIVFPNGSRILFRYCDNDKDALRFQGTEVDVLFVDEATQQSEEKMEKLRACVRGVNDFPKRVYYTCNPGGEGHAWVKRLFIDRRFKEGEEPEEHSFIQSLITDNTALMEADPQYIKQLEVLPPKLRDAWLYGNWEIFEGQFFEDFRTEPDMRAAEAHGESLTADELRAQRRWVHVIEPFDLSTGSCRGWRIMRSYDFGYGKPFSCAWWAIDYDGVIYRILVWITGRFIITASRRR